MQCGWKGFRKTSTNFYIIKYLILIAITLIICFVLSELISVARQYLPVAGIETWLTETPSQSSFFAHS